MATELALQKAARAWCKESTEKKVMDPTLAEEFANILDQYIEALQWCGGSDDFCPGGRARRGWNKLIKPLLSSEAASIRTKSRKGGKRMDNQIASGPKGANPITGQESDLLKRFTYHPPRGNQADRYHLIRDRALSFALIVDNECPASREKSLALTKLEESVMWANAAIARNE